MVEGRAQMAVMVMVRGVMVIMSTMVLAVLAMAKEKSHNAPPG
jgi:hypothetical protein